jgi:DUF218 domain
MKLSGSIKTGIAIVVPLAALAVFAARAGSMLVMDAPERSDVILVLAGETDLRPARALLFLEQGYGRRVLLDVPAGAKIFGVTELQLAEKYAQDVSHGGAVRVCPIVGLSTRDESRDAAKCLAKEEGAHVLIVTSDFHTRRALSIFRHEIRRKSFSVAAAYDGTQFGTHWWTHRQWAKTCLEEWLRLLWWNAVDQWR